LNNTLLNQKSKR